MTDQYEHLEGLAREATPGPWGVHEQRPGPATSVSGTFVHAGPDEADDTGFSLVVRAYTRDGLDERQHNAAYIAAANPQAILKLIAENRAYREAVENALPLLEVLHSLTTAPDVRKVVWKAIAEARAALNPAQQGGQSQ